MKSLKLQTDFWTWTLTQKSFSKQTTLNVAFRSKRQKHPSELFKNIINQCYNWLIMYHCITTTLFHKGSNICSSNSLRRQNNKNRETCMDVSMNKTKQRVFPFNTHQTDSFHLAFLFPNSQSGCFILKRSWHFDFIWPHSENILSWVCKTQKHVFCSFFFVHYFSICRQWKEKN